MALMPTRLGYLGSAEHAFLLNDHDSGVCPGDKVRSPLQRLKGPVGLGFAWRWSLVRAKNPSIGSKLPRLFLMFAHASASGQLAV
jgi:hypothetical protein